MRRKLAFEGEEKYFEWFEDNKYELLKEYSSDDLKEYLDEIGKGCEEPLLSDFSKDDIIFHLSFGYDIEVINEKIDDTISEVLQKIVLLKLNGIQQSELSEEIFKLLKKYE